MDGSDPVVGSVVVLPAVAADEGTGDDGMKTGLVVLAIAVIGGGSTMFLRGLGSAQRGDAIPDGALFAVRHGDLTVTVTENGSVMAKNSQKITPLLRRGGKITFLVEEGKLVEEGEILCKFDSTEFETELQKLELDIVKTDADLDTAKTELEIQQVENVANIEKAQLALTKARISLEKYRKGDAPKEQRTLDIALKDAKVKLKQAEQAYKDSQRLMEHGYTSTLQVEQDEILLDQAKVQLISAKVDIELFNKYTFPMTVQEKEAALKDAQRTFETAKKRSKSALRQKEVGVEGNERRLENLQKKLKDVSENIEHCTLKSPSPGIVIYGDPNESWYRQQVKIGGQVWGGTTLFTIPDLRVMQVRLEIHEADINKIKEGQTATVTMDTYPGLVAKGEVTKIATIAGGGDGRQRESEVKRFTVDITLESSGEIELKPGISAKAVLFIEKLEDVLYVPLQCVYLEEGEHFSYVMGEDGRPTQVAVKPGITNDTYIQILEGLDENDRVLLYNPTIGANPQVTPPKREALTAPVVAAEKRDGP